MCFPLKKNSAFTLIEMLVVLAVLIILAMFIVFGMNYARDQVGVTKCLSNLRQVHAALMLYVQDNNGMMPGPLTGAMTPYFKLSNKGVPTANQMAGYLAPYLDVPMPVMPGDGAFNYYLSCPAHLASMSAAERKSPNIIRSYGIPLATSDYPFGYTAGGTPSAEPKNYHAYVTTHSASRTWMMRDDDQALHPGNTQFNLEPNHKTGRNYLYFDGSARFLTFEGERTQGQ